MSLFQQCKNKKFEIWATCDVGVLGVGGGWGGIFIVNINERITGKLRRIILLTFRIHARKTRQPSTFIVLGSGGRDHDSQN